MTPVAPATNTRIVLRQGTAEQPRACTRSSERLGVADERQREVGKPAVAPVVVPPARLVEAARLGLLRCPQLRVAIAAVAHRLLGRNQEASRETSAPVAG